MRATRANYRGRRTIQGQRYLAGEIIDNKYRLVRELGEGGTATVWVADNLVLDVQVAIKLIPLKEGDETNRLTDRLLQEARATIRLAHPGIVPVFDSGKTRHGDPFVVMELLHGETLQMMLEREARIPAIPAVQVLLPIADALASAHAKSIVHRDIKPANVFLATNGAGRVQPKLLDFGIARLTETNRKLTANGILLGTPDYMSPEQAVGSEVDARSDIWSYSIVLYEAVTGRMPFSGLNYNALIWSVTHDAPLPISEFASGDSALWRIIERGLRKSPDERFQSMREYGEALALWLHERGIEDDACGASLRTNWLETSGLVGRLSLHSTLPPPRTELPSVPEQVVDNPAPSPARRGASNWLWTAAGISLLMIGLGTGFVILRAQHPQSRAPERAALPMATGATNSDHRPGTEAPVPAPALGAATGKPDYAASVVSPAANSESHPAPALPKMRDPRRLEPRESATAPAARKPSRNSKAHELVPGESSDVDLGF